MSKKRSRHVVVGSDRHPHFLLTSEPFPRLLATRDVSRKNATYFGAFLNRTAVRILIDFLNRVFKLRTCDIAIDGTFAVPCTQYFDKRCLAPCVADLCGPEEYQRSVKAATYFLENDRDSLIAFCNASVENCSQAADFEKAAYWRDIMQAARKYWSDPRLNVWLDDTVDTFATDHIDGTLYVIVITQRSRRILGRLIFTITDGVATPVPDAIGEIIEQLYKFHVPREIRVPVIPADKASLETDLTKRFGRPIKIVLSRANDKRTTARAVEQVKQEITLKRIGLDDGSETDPIEWASKFGLESGPKRIEAFDAAHISGKFFAAAVAVWSNGRFRSEEFDFATPEAASEIETLAGFIRERYSRRTAAIPDIVLIDGGAAHLAAAAAAVPNPIAKRTVILAAVKPRGKHSEIDRFLTVTGKSIPFDAKSRAMNLLKLLRDEAHSLANQVHRSSRDLKFHYELAALLPSITPKERTALLSRAGSVKELLGLEPEAIASAVGRSVAERVISDLRKFKEIGTKPVQVLIVPIRYVDPNGSADDLRPIVTR